MDQASVVLNIYCHHWCDRFGMLPLSGSFVSHFMSGYPVWNKCLINVSGIENCENSQNLCSHLGKHPKKNCLSITYVSVNKKSQASNIEITAEGSQHSKKTYWHLSSVYLNSACPHFPSEQWEWLRSNISLFSIFKTPLPSTWRWKRLHNRAQNRSAESAWAAGMAK
jgi:hypothetical protein